MTAPNSQSFIQRHIIYQVAFTERSAVRLITSKDVVHSFWVPQFRLKQDAVPGKIVKLLLTPTVVGSYTLLCAELCGMEHTEMTALVEVVEAVELEAKLKEQNW